jgi:hypothetical protein
MTAITPATVTEIKGAGPHKILIARFSTCSDNDTWASGLQGLTATPIFIAGPRGDPGTQAAAGCNIDFTLATGAVTFHPGTDSLALDLMVII